MSGVIHQFYLLAAETCSGLPRRSGLETGILDYRAQDRKAHARSPHSPGYTQDLLSAGDSSAVLQGLAGLAIKRGNMVLFTNMQARTVGIALASSGSNGAVPRPGWGGGCNVNDSANEHCDLLITESSWKSISMRTTLTLPRGRCPVYNCFREFSSNAFLNLPSFRALQCCALDFLSCLYTSWLSNLPPELDVVVAQPQAFYPECERPGLCASSFDGIKERWTKKQRLRGPQGS